MVGLQRWRDAADELTAAIALGATRPRAYLLRSRCYDALRDPDKAQADRRRAVSATPIDDQDWAARALALSSGSAERALADIAAGLERYPRSVVLLRNQIHLLGDIQRRERDAAEAATRLLEVLPNDVPALLSRAVCFARLGDPASALRDARRAEAQALRPVDQLQLACVYALVATRDAGQRPRAVKWLREGLSADPSLVRRVAGDSDLASIAGDTDVRELVAAATKLVEARP
jgi:tetratricopeptide (TPR) repeat protein